MEDLQHNGNMDTIDPKIKNFVSALGKTETGDDPNAYTKQGQSGEFGRYQFMPDTYRNYAQKYLGDSHAEPSVENQNKIAYSFVKEKKEAGYSPAQIASMWNAGEGEPDAYTGTFKNGKPSVGTNSMGVHYDVPGHALKVSQYYNELSGNQNNGAGVNNLPQVDQFKPAPSPTKEQDTYPNEYGAVFRSTPGENGLNAGLKAIGNLPSSFLNLGKGIVNAISHPIDTVTGLGHLAAGGMEKGIDALAGFSKEDTTNLPENLKLNQQTFDAFKSALVNRYGSLENAQKTATEDPAGFGADVMSLMEGGATALDKVAGTTALENLNKVGTKVAQPVKYANGVLPKLVGQTLGLETGVGYEPIKQGLQASNKGGDALKSFTQALRGNTSPDQLVTQARDALDQVVESRSQEYRKMLSTMQESTKNFDISPILKEINNQMKNYNISMSNDGTLDFSRSKIRFNNSAQNDINTIVNEMKNFGTKAGDRTAVGVDNLKQAFYDLDNPSSSVRSFTSAVSKATRSVLEEHPGYSQSMKAYSDATDAIKDIKQSLSLGDKAAVETSFKKLTSALKNNDFRKQVLQELDEATGSNLMSSIAGQRLSSIVPRGLAGVFEGGVGGITAVTHSAAILPLLGLAITTSPRVVGEFIRALGIGLKGRDRLMNVLNKFSQAPLVGNLVNRVTEKAPQ